VQWRSTSAPKAPFPHDIDAGCTLSGNTNEVPENTTGTSSTRKPCPFEVIAAVVSWRPFTESMEGSAGLLRAVQAAMEIHFAKRRRLSTQALQCAFLRLVAELLAFEINDQGPSGANPVLRRQDSLGYLSGRIHQEV
jgi:hypothetical protein